MVQPLQTWGPEPEPLFRRRSPARIVARTNSGERSYGFRNRYASSAPFGPSIRIEKPDLSIVCDSQTFHAPGCSPTGAVTASSTARLSSGGTMLLSRTSTAILETLPATRFATILPAMPTSGRLTGTVFVRCGNICARPELAYHACAICAFYQNETSLFYRGSRCREDLPNDAGRVWDTSSMLLNSGAKPTLVIAASSRTAYQRNRGNGTLEDFQWQCRCNG